MTRSNFSAKPAVLRCSRCGRFVDWADARLQVVCRCRPHLDLPPVLVREATDEDRKVARQLFQRDFGHLSVVAFGEVMALDEAPAIVAEMQGDIAGALAYRTIREAFQMLALATDPMWQRSGVGAYLVAEAELLARRLGLPRIVLSTTNDNLPALYFYQRRGYRIANVVPNGITEHSHGESATGFAGIPIRDEIRLEKQLAETQTSPRGA